MKVKILLIQWFIEGWCFILLYDRVEESHIPINLSRFLKNDSFTSISMWVLKNWLQVDEKKSNMDFPLFSS